MARPIEPGLDYFPTWNPQFATVSRFGSSDKRIRLKALRHSSSAFIKRQDVRDFVFNRDGNKCKKCGNTENLQVDHIVSVYRCANGEIEIEFLNSANNLQTLCIGCNSAKLP